MKLIIYSVKLTNNAREFINSMKNGSVMKMFSKKLKKKISKTLIQKQNQQLNSSMDHLPFVNEKLLKKLII